MAKRILSAVGLALVAMLGIAPARAEQPVTIVVAYAPGGTTDTIARILAARLAERIEQTVIVENKPGATGQVGAKHVARSAPDGRTIMIATQTTHAVAPSLYKAIGYDPLKDFTPITLAAWTPLVLVTGKTMPAASTKELIAYLKQRPGEVRYATGGRGDGSHLASLFFNKMADVSSVAVPYQGEGPAIPAVMGGHLPYMFCSAPTVAAMIETGDIKALAVTSRMRAAILPNVPTLGEEGLEGYEMVNWWGFFGPAGMPREIVDRYARAFSEILKEPETREKLTKLGYVVTGSTPDEFRRYVEDENRKWGTVIASQGLTPQ